MMNDDPCKVCGVPLVEHTVKETVGEIMHRHSKDGQLVRVSRDKGTEQTPSSESHGRQINIVVSPAPDLALRRLLVELGVLTEAQLASVVELSTTLPVT